MRFLENNPGEALLKVIPVCVVSMLTFLFENISSFKTHYLYIANLHSEWMLVIVLDLQQAGGLAQTLVYEMFFSCVAIVFQSFCPALCPLFICHLEFILNNQESVKMSSRRKRAPPVKVDEERQQQLHWNMHEDLRNEPLNLTIEQPCSGADSSSDCILIDDDTPEDVVHRDKKRRSEAVSTLESTEKETPLSVKLNVTVSPYHVDHSWKAFLGDFALQLLPEESLVEHFSERSFALMSSESSNQFLIYVHSECKDEEKQESVCKESADVCTKGLRVESSFSSDMLQDLAWLQKKKGIKLYQRPEGSHMIKVLTCCAVL